MVLVWCCKNWGQSKKWCADDVFTLWVNNQVTNRRTKLVVNDCYVNDLFFGCPIWGLASIWRFPKIELPQIIHLNRIFMDFPIYVNHPFWGTPICGNPHFAKIHQCQCHQCHLDKIRNRWVGIQWCGPLVAGGTEPLAFVPKRLREDPYWNRTWSMSRATTSPCQGWTHGYRIFLLEWSRPAEIQSNKYSDILSDIPSDIPSGILFGILSDTYSDIHSIWHIFTHSVWQVFGFRRALLHPRLSRMLGSMRAPTQLDLSIGFTCWAPGLVPSHNQLAGGGGGLVPLLKSRDPHLAGKEWTR